jgi:serine/threonine-protein kinase HipA
MQADLVTTTAYIRNDVPALTLAGTKKWWPHKFLERFAVVNLSLPKATVLAIFDRMAQAVTETQRLIPRYISEHPEFRDVGERIMASWDEGLKGLVD